MSVAELGLGIVGLGICALMGKRKKLLLKIEDKHRFIAEHQAKINNELRKANPDEGLVKHWQSEIRGARSSVARYGRRLGALGWKI